MKYWTVLFTLSFFFILIANAINIKNTEKSRLPIPASIHNPKTEYRQAIHFRIKNELSDSPETKKLDNAIEKFLRKWEIKGASFALMKDNKLVYAKGYGIADNETGTTPSNIFRIASVSKLITAAGIMKLVESGRLKLDDCVFGENGILNDNDFTNIKDSRIKDITVEHLLRHRSGFSSRIFPSYGSQNDESIPAYFIPYAHSICDFEKTALYAGSIHLLFEFRLCHLIEDNRKGIGERL